MDRVRGVGALLAGIKATALLDRGARQEHHDHRHHANSGVRFETGLSEFHISNRVQGSLEDKYKISTEAKVNLKLSLGQLIRDPIYFEAEPQFMQQAYFKTAIHMRNAFQGGAPAKKG